MIEILCWCATRADFVQGMTTTTLPIEGAPPEQWPALCTLADDGTTLVPLPGIAIDEIGEIVKSPAVLDEQGNVIAPAVVIGGHHVNLLAHGAIADMLTAGLPQTDADGNLLDVFTRTRILSLIPGMTWEAISQAGEPAGYVGLHGVKLYDRSAVANRARVWFGA